MQTVLIVIGAVAGVLVVGSFAVLIAFVTNDWSK